jgi:anti-anti-sigma factor
MIAKTETLGGCKILRVSGRIDFESALDFEHHINAMIQEAGDCYIIELSQVELLSSAGLRVMLSTAKRVAHRNAGLALAAPSQVVRQVFEISHFNLLFKIYPSVPAAIAALKGTAEEAPLEESTQESPEASAPDGLEETKSTEQVLPSVELERQAPRQNVETTPSGSIAPGSPPPIVAVPPPPPTSPGVNAPQPPDPLSVVGTPTVAPPSLPPIVPSSTEGPDATAVPNQEAGPTQRTPPPLPPQTRLAPAPPSLVQSPAARPVGTASRREAKYPALLEVRAEGISYPCKDGDVIGTEGRLAQPYFSQISQLAPRHLLIGLLEGRWFVFTPKNVQHPFILDGVALRAGERKMLQYVEHQVEFSGHVFGFRLVAKQPKEGFFSRIFGRKR